LAYGPRIKGAVLNKGVKQFLQKCRLVNAKVYIISHKTKFAKYDETRTNLRRSAMDWMSNQALFDYADLGLSPRDVFFEQTRQDKLQRITNLNCSYFVDDLEEVLIEKSFPTGVAKILYDPHNENRSVSGVVVAGDWVEISHLIFGLAQPHVGL